MSGTDPGPGTAPAVPSPPVGPLLEYGYDALMGVGGPPAGGHRARVGAVGVQRVRRAEDRPQPTAAER